MAATVDAHGVLAQLGLSYSIDTSDQFWGELEDIADPEERTLSSVDYAVRAFIAFAAQFYDRFLLQERDLLRCVDILLESQVFHDFGDRCTDDIIELVLTTNDPSLLELGLCFLLSLGRRSPHVLRNLRRRHAIPATDPLDAINQTHRSVFRVLLDALERYGKDGVHVEAHGNEPERTRFARTRLGPTAAALTYEVCKVSRLAHHELALFTEEYTLMLFGLVESTRDDDERFNYALIRIAINEQFMVASMPSDSPRVGSAARRGSVQAGVDSNIVIRTLRTHHGAMKTFGENLIFQLNRLDGGQEDLCVALLILKVLYVLFTTPGTADFLYLNDARVLLDIILRELVDLPEESEGLRHTYLRVLHPLLNNTQLRDHQYKRQQIRRVLHSLVSSPHLREVNPTTKRLVDRNLSSPWCQELGDSSDNSYDSRRSIQYAARPTQLPVLDRSMSSSPEPHEPLRSRSYEALQSDLLQSPPMSVRRSSHLRNEVDMSSSTVSVNAVAAAHHNREASGSTASLVGTADTTGEKKRRAPPPRPSRSKGKPAPSSPPSSLSRRLDSLTVTS